MLVSWRLVIWVVTREIWWTVIFSPGLCFDSGGVDGLAEGALFGGVFIDDPCAISLVPWLRTNISPSVGGKVALAADAVYAAKGWPQSV